MILKYAKLVRKQGKVVRKWLILKSTIICIWRDYTMKLINKRLDSETQLLVGISAAVASGCIPCLEKMAGMANKAGIDPKKIKESAMIGQFVKVQPEYHMKEAADKLLGTHFLKHREQSDCQNDDEKTGGGSCDCASDNENEPCGCIN